MSYDDADFETTEKAGRASHTSCKGSRGSSLPSEEAPAGTASDAEEGGNPEEDNRPAEVDSPGEGSLEGGLAGNNYAKEDQGVSIYGAVVLMPSNAQFEIVIGRASR